MQLDGSDHLDSDALPTWTVVRVMVRRPFHKLALLPLTIIIALVVVASAVALLIPPPVFTPEGLSTIVHYRRGIGLFTGRGTCRRRSLAG